LSINFASFRLAKIRFFFDINEFFFTRVASYNGVIDIDSRAGEGTEINIGVNVL